MSEVTRILIVRFSSIGDIVLTTPVIRYLKNQLEGEVEIHYLTKKNYRSLLDFHPDISVIHTIEKDTSEILDDLKKWDFNYVVDLHNNFRSAQIKRALRAFAFTFHKVNIAKWLFVNFGIDRLPDEHVVDRYLGALKAFNIQDDGLGLELHLDPDAKVEAPESRYVSVAIGAAHQGKRMSVPQMAEMIDQIKLPVLLLGGDEDVGPGKEVCDLVTVNKVHNLCGKYSLQQSARLVDQSEVVVSGDTGLMHMAAARNRKIVSVWGCTSPRFGMAPYRPHPDSIILEPVQLKKRPCSKLGNRCKYGMDNRCITHVSSSEISGAVNSLISRQTGL